MIALLVSVVASVSAQTRLKAASAAGFLREPSGLRLGSLVTGVTYPTGRTNAGHVETTIEGWIPVASTAATTRDGFDVTVTAGSGETVRASPGGAVVARVQEGTLLSRVGTRGTWVRVRRSGWVVRTALERPDAVTAAVPPPDTRTRAVPPPAATVPAVAPPPAPTVAAATRPTQASQRPDSARRTDAPVPEMVSSRGTLRKGTAMAGSPDGARIGTLDEVDVDVKERQREWVKVAVEGWVRSADLAAEVDAAPRVTGAMVRQHPERFVGQTVTWRLQYLSVQEADALRPEMPAGQAYVLARGPLPEAGFVYLMVTKEQAAEFRARSPLDELAVDAVIRAGRTKYLPTPVLEFLQFAGKL